MEERGPSDHGQEDLTVDGWQRCKSVSEQGLYWMVISGFPTPLMEKGGNCIVAMIQHICDTSQEL